MMQIRAEDALIRYGEIVGGKWADEAKWCTLITAPDTLTWINSATGDRTSHIYCNKDIALSLTRALLNVVERGLNDQLKTFDGCYEVRDVRAMPGSLSAHSYALAIDINAKENPLGGPATLSTELVKCFIDEGFAWGGEFHRIDGMHFTFGW